MPITSKHNELVKKIRKLSDRKWRYAYGEYIAEGKRWVCDARERCPQDVVAVVCSADMPFADADHVLDGAVFDTLTDTENSQGVLAIMRMPATGRELRAKHILYLDRIRDPGNMGTILRTACAAGYTDILLDNCVDVYNPKVIRSCMTGILGVRFPAGFTLQDVRKAGYTTVAATLDGESVFTASVGTSPVCLVIGNEADGIRSDIMQACDRRVTIPMESGMESLNAAVSAGILMYVTKFGKV